MSHCIIVHGGAWTMPKPVLEDHLDGCRKGAEVGNDVLTAKGSALDAVEAAVRYMEEDPVFNAGRGAHMNAKGEVELDAMIMEGGSLRFGSVASVRHVLHPVSLARQVMERTEHCMLVADGAESFARDIGFPLVRNEDLLVGPEVERWREIQAREGFQSKEVFERNEGDSKFGTVGAVALDDLGHIAAATSTGGTPSKMPGRVGDSPLVGSGCYADDRSGGVSATGWGESIMKVCLARKVCEGIERGEDARSASDAAIRHLGERVSGLGGVITIDHECRMAFSFNTPRMAVAMVDRKGKRSSFI
ncbi:MAG: isoaspartyl peptidase/L-asparaginase [Methanomassiliicoccales archaeon]|nr:isoaspartyl peptidase/L-asparaginase [Methanomassiliicoccales archaeon]